MVLQKAIASALSKESLARSVSPAVAAALREKGYAVIDKFFGNECARALREEVLRVHGAQHMSRNHTHLVHQSQTYLLPKARIWEFDSMGPDWARVTAAAAPALHQLHAGGALRGALHAHLPALHLHSHATKLQFNEGSGGCFPVHFDSDRDLDPRQLTAIAYLNPDWAPGHGGELRLYPFPEAPVDVEPVFDRVVVFSSPNMLHRVLPSQRPRVCFTVWLSAAALPPPRQEGAPGGLADILRAHKYRKFLCKAVHAEEWAASIQDSHEASEEREALLEAHWKDVAIIRKVFRNVLPDLEGPGAPPPASSLRIDWLA